MDASFVRVSLLAATLVVALGVRPVAAQGESVVVHDLTGAEVTEQQLLEILTPKCGAPEPLRARGLGVVTRPSCASQRREMTRGIAPKPVADVAAIRIHFAFDSADLLPEARRELEVLARVLGSPQFSASCFRIEGHADSTPQDKVGDKWRLSCARATAVWQYLQQSGVAVGEISVRCAADGQPADKGISPEAQAANRRVVLYQLGGSPSR